MGSSGVGKSTLVNTLMGEEAQKTGSIREDDSKGRHTTTGRTLMTMPSGAVLLDTPGMRELQLANVSQGLSETFSDVEDWHSNVALVTVHIKRTRLRRSEGYR